MVKVFSRLSAKIPPGLFIILAACFWGSLLIFIRKFNAYGFTGLETVALRCTGSFIWLVLYAFFFEKDKRARDRLSAFKLRLADCRFFVGSGLFSIVFFSWCYFENAVISSAALAAVLLYTSPVFVMLLSRIFFKEKITTRKSFAVVIAFLGSALVSKIFETLKTGGEISPLGLLFGFGSAIGYALYSIFGRFALERGYRPMVVTLYTFLFASVGSLLLIDVPLLFERLASTQTHLLWLAMGLFGSCLPFSLYTVALKRMEAGRAAVLAMLEPIMTTLAGVFLYGEVLGLSEIIGIVLVLTAGIIVIK